MAKQASEPPPSMEVPTSGGSGKYIVGIVVLLGAAVALFVWKRNSTPPAGQQSTTVTVTASAPPKQEPPPPVYAPPPPPKLEDPEPPPTASTPAPKGTGGVAQAPAGPCGGSCQGSATGQLSSALRGTAQSAQGCYNRALRNSEVSGSLTVSVQVSPTGSVCSASIVNDTVHSAEISSCVLSRFRGKSFPPPQGGCVTVNIPISFTIKQ